MANIGNPYTPVGKKVVLCGSGELGKEIAIELERYGVHVVAGGIPSSSAARRLIPSLFIVR